MHNVPKAGRSRPYLWRRSADLVPLGMTDALTDFDRAVIEALGVRYARGGEVALDEATSRLIVPVCAVLAHSRGTGLAR